MACQITIEPPIGRADGLFVEGTVTGGMCASVLIEVAITSPTAQQLEREVPVVEGRWKWTFPDFAKNNCGGTAAITVRCSDKDSCEDRQTFIVACRNCPVLVVADIVPGACTEDDDGEFNSRSVTIKVRAQMGSGEPTPVIGRMTIQLPNGTKVQTQEFNYDGHQRDFTFTLRAGRSYEGALTLDTPHGCTESKPVSFSLESCNQACLPEPGPLVVRRLDGSAITDTEACVDAEKVDVIAPSYHVTGLNWSTEPPVTTERDDAQHRLRVTLPADGRRLYVHATVGNGICTWGRTTSVKLCLPTSSGGTPPGGGGTPPGGGGTPPGGGGTQPGGGGGGGEAPNLWCLLWMILSLILALVGGAILTFGFCLTSYVAEIVAALVAASIISAGSTDAAAVIIVIIVIVIIVIGAILLLAGTISLLLWLLVCGSCRANCTLLKWLRNILGVITAFWFIVSAIAGAIAALAAIFFPVLTNFCWVGSMIAAADFGLLLVIVIYYMQAVGCDDWPEGWPERLRLRIPDPLKFICKE